MRDPSAIAPPTGVSPEVRNPTVAEHEAELWRRFRSDADPALREQLVHLYLPYARAIAAQLYARRGGQAFEFEDYFQYASIGLMECVDRYLPDQGASFKTYATTRITGAVLNGLDKLTERQQQVSIQRRANQHQARVESLLDDDDEESTEALFRRLAAVGVGVALGVLLEGSGLIEPAVPMAATAPGAYEHVELKQLRQRVLDLVKALPEREQHIIRSHYLQDIPFQDIAAQLGVTKGRVSQLHRRALDFLREELARRRDLSAFW